MISKAMAQLLWQRRVAEARQHAKIQDLESLCADAEREASRLRATLDDTAVRVSTVLPLPDFCTPHFIHLTPSQGVPQHKPGLGKEKDELRRFWAHRVGYSSGALNFFHTHTPPSRQMSPIPHRLAACFRPSSSKSDLPGIDCYRRPWVPSSATTCCALPGA